MRDANEGPVFDGQTVETFAPSSAGLGRGASPPRSIFGARP
jgi:hypothetical protein